MVVTNDNKSHNHTESIDKQDRSRLKLVKIKRKGDIHSPVGKIILGTEWKRFS